MSEKSCDIIECQRNKMGECELFGVTIDSIGPEFGQEGGIVSIHPKTCWHRKFIKKCNETPPE